MLEKCPICNEEIQEGEGVEVTVKVDDNEESAVVCKDCDSHHTEYYKHDGEILGAWHKGSKVQ